MKILFTTHLPAEGFAMLAGHTLLIPDTPYRGRDELIRLLPEADVLVATFDYTVSAELLAIGKMLKLVANFGVGYNNIDVAYCHEHNILVTNTPQPVIEPTAEHCFALLHAIAHRTAELDRKMRDPETEITFGVMNNLGVSLYGKTLGIIGMGRIGQAVARRALAAGMHIIYHNRHRLPEDVETFYQATYVEQKQLLTEADFVSLNLPYTPEVHHLIDSEALRIMKPTARLINTARGAHVDEDALVEALRTGIIAGAALDVYEHEPKVHPGLLELVNVVLSPHIGTGTIDGRLSMCRNVAENIVLMAQGKSAEMNLV